MKKYEWLWKSKSGRLKRQAIIRQDISEAKLLIKYCKLAEIGIVEIGRKYGGSTYIIADSSTVPVISIDPSLIQVIPELKSLIETKRVTLINERSEKVKLTNKYDVLFIDGDHFKGPSRDVNNYWSNLTNYAIFHDYLFHKKPVQKLNKRSGDIVYSAKTGDPNPIMQVVDCLVENKCCEILEQAESMIAVKKLRNFKSFNFPNIIEL